MTEAIFFDWFQTLAPFDPPREELHSRAYSEFGVEITPQKLLRGLLIADNDWFQEANKLSMEKRSPEEQMELRLRYQDTVLAEAGMKVSRELHLKVVKKVQQLHQRIAFALYDDVLSALKRLKERHFTLGVLTNASKDALPFRELGVEPYLDFVVTSAEVGVNKPAAPIFLAALAKAGVAASAAVHVGDQYYLDVAGARGVGITPVLIDRYDFYSAVSDCPLIHTLDELDRYL